MIRFVSAAGSAALILGLATAAPAEARSTGGCPVGGSWTLTSLADLGIDPSQASGIPSLDGNRDGYTCIMPLKNSDVGVFVFRDNTVQGGS